MIVTGRAPHLYDCFNAADLLVTDISSVVSDFLAGAKPYAVTNALELPADEFVRRYPSAAAGYLLDPGCSALAEAVAAAGDPARDRLAERRDVLRADLLGPDEPDAMTRFNDAVNRLAARAHGGEAARIPGTGHQAPARTVPAPTLTPAPAPAPTPAPASGYVPQSVPVPLPPLTSPPPLAPLPTPDDPARQRPYLLTASAGGPAAGRADAPPPGPRQEDGR
jgi:hypothetical protein